MIVYYSYYIYNIFFPVLYMSHIYEESDHSLQSSYLLEHFLLLLQMVASDGVQQSVPVTVNILIIDANDNTPTFSQVSYNIDVFTNMQAGETVIQVSSTLMYNLNINIAKYSVNYALFFFIFLYYHVQHKMLNHCFWKKPFLTHICTFLSF